MVLLLSPAPILRCAEPSPPPPCVGARPHVQIKLLGVGTVPFKRVMQDYGFSESRAKLFIEKISTLCAKPAYIDSRRKPMLIG